MIGLALVMFPVIFHRLGPVRYGARALISEVTAYYSYVGLGFLGGLAYYASLGLAQGKQRELNRAAALLGVVRGQGLMYLSLVHPSVVQPVSRAVALAVTYIATRLALLEISFSLSPPDSDSLRELARFGAPCALTGVGWLTGRRADLIVIGAGLGVSAVSYYSIPRFLMGSADSSVHALCLSFAPPANLHARGERRAMVQRQPREARICLAVFGFTELTAVFGESFSRSGGGAHFPACLGGIARG